MSVTETTRYIYCHAIDWLRISSCYQIYIYIHLYLLTKISRTENKEGTSTIFSKKNYSNPPKYISVLQESRFQSLFSFFQNIIEARDWLITNFEKKKKKNNNPTIKVEHWISSNFKIQTIFPKARPRRISKPWSFPRERSRWERRRTRIVAFG